MISYPNAKINFGLRILSKRSDGYHTIETIFLPIALSDLLEIVPRSAKTTCYERLGSSGNSLQAIETPAGDYFCEQGDFPSSAFHSNSILQVVALLRKEGYSIPPLHIELYKRIPSGAGLGGGSSNATFALTLLNELFNLQIALEKQVQLLRTIGADCPFFLYNQPSIAGGIGDQLQPIKLPTSLQNSFVTLIKPPFCVSTAEAYQHAILHPECEGQLLELLKLDHTAWKNEIINDFEESLLVKHPILASIKERLYDLGAYFVLLSGSGPTLFALSQSPLVIDYKEPLLQKSFIWQGTLL